MKYTILMLVAVLILAIGFLVGSLLRTGLTLQDDEAESIEARYDEDIILSRLMLDFMRSPNRFQQNIEDIKRYTLISSYRLMHRPGYEDDSGSKSLISSLQKFPETILESDEPCTNLSTFGEIVITADRDENILTPCPRGQDNGEVE